MNPLDLERLAVRIERLRHTSTHGWSPGDELEFRRGFPPRGPRILLYQPNELPDPVWLREVAGKMRQGVVGEGWNPDTLPGIYRNALQVALRMEGLIRDNDPRNPKRIIRDLQRGRLPGWPR